MPGLPFDNYPHGGRRPLDKKRGSNCRREYCLELHKLVGQTACVYCETSLVDSYEHWLLMVCEHVVPEVSVKKLGIPKDVIDNYSNLALCCSACNNFVQYKFDADVIAEWSRLTANGWGDSLWDRFWDLRDAVYTEKLRQSQEKHGDEMRLYEGTWVPLVSGGH